MTLAPRAKNLTFAANVVGLLMMGKASLQVGQAQVQIPSELAGKLVEGPDGKLVFENGPEDPEHAVLKFQQLASGKFAGQVAGANKEFKVGRLPATFLMEFAAGGICTATLIGPRVVLTAAHCVDMRRQVNGIWQTIPGSVRLAGEQHRRRFKDGGCEMPKLYTDAEIPEKRVPRNSKDWALCELRQVMEHPQETLSIDTEEVAPGRPVMIAGFGCTEAELTGQLITGKERSRGKLTVGDNVWAVGRSAGRLMTYGRVGTGAAIICPGDSGGAAYSNASTRSGNNIGWRVTAINSSVGPSPAQLNRWAARSGKSPIEAPDDTPPGIEFVSYLAPLSDPDFAEFLTTFVANGKDAAGRPDPDVRLICLFGKYVGGRCRR